MDQSAQREEELFAAALALPEAERAGYLKRECGADAELRRRVGALLRAHETIGGFLDRPPEANLPDIARAAASKTPEQALGTTIGRYKLLEKIGEGGCGVVYLAEQEEPIHRRVALKVIRLGMDTQEVIARFEAERQALALMDHPNIAKVLDAGAAESGRPYFVMELVRGVKITAYCDEHNLSTADRLHLFTEVCHAIQHAHQKGIIHRDIKPSNILVTLQDGEPVPKVIDFGIAKASQGRLTDHTLFTAFEQFIGTPAYMSPEQAELSSQDVDTRSDIYSLGVLLYELLTGQTPFDAKSLLRAGLDEIRRVIREVEPPKPSTRLSTLTVADRATVAKLRGTAPAQLSTLIRGDLDWIVMRCLEKNRLRRYETAAALADDLSRHLAHRPIIARPPGIVYRGRKFARRNRQSLVIGITALLLGLSAGSWLYLRERPAPSPGPPRLALPSERPDRVGALGEPDALVITGNRTFSAEAIRDGLASSNDFLLAAHPDASIDDFVKAVRNAIERGYRSRGFPDVFVTVRPTLARHQLDVTVVEGPRFTRGEVRATSTGTVTPADIIRVLTTPDLEAGDPLTEAVQFILRQQRAPRQQAQLQAAFKQAANAQLPSMELGTGSANPPSISPAEQALAALDLRMQGTVPIWERGKPAAFDESALSGVQIVLRQYLGERGYPLAAVNAKLQRDLASRRVDLVVDIREGPAAVVGTIQVRGHARNTADEIVRCAGLAPGMPLNTAALARAQVALWNSARFYSFDIRLRPRTPAVPECDVDIEVDESEVMPPLREPLPRQQAALVRFANWLTTETARRELVLSLESPAAVVSAVITPAWDLAASLRGLGADAGQLLAFLMRHDGFRLFGTDGTRNAGMDLVRTPIRLDGYLHLITSGEPNRRANLSFGAAFRTDVRGGTIARPTFIVSPIFACQFLAAEVTTRFVDGDVVLLDAKFPSRYRFREDTGELVEWVWNPQAGDRSSSGAEPGKPERLSLHLRLATNEFSRIADQVDRGWIQLLHDPAHRLSLADLLLDIARRTSFADLLPGVAPSDEAKNPPKAQRYLLNAATAIRLIERLQASPHLSAALASAQSAGENDFSIPPDPQAPWQPNAFATMVGPGCYALARQLGPPQAWLARLGRELYYLAVGRTEHTAAVLDELAADPSMGPLGSLITARLLRQFQSQAAWRFARRALEHNSIEEFHSDCALLLGRDSWLSRTVADALPAVAALTDPEIDALTGDLDVNQAKLVREVVITARHVKVEGVATAFQPLLDRWWTQQMQPHLAANIGALLGGTRSLDPATVAATVNGMALSRRLLDLARRNPRLLVSVPPGPAFPAEPGQPAPDAVLESLIVLTQVVQDAAIRGFDVSDAATDRTVETFVRAQANGDWRAFESRLQADGLTLADYRELVRLNGVFSSVRNAVERNAPPPTDDDIATALAQPSTTRHIQCIGVPVVSGDRDVARNLAEAIRSEALGPGGFAAVWAKYDGKGPGQPRRSDFPNRQRSDFQAALGEVAFDLPPGDVSRVMDTGNTFTVIHYVDPAIPAEQARRRELIMAELTEQARRRAFEDYLNRLRATTFVCVLPAPPAPMSRSP